MWPGGVDAIDRFPDAAARMERVAQAALQSGFAQEERGEAGLMMAARLEWWDGDETQPPVTAAATLLVNAPDDATLQAARRRLYMAVDVPALYLSQWRGQQQAQSAQRLEEALGLTARILACDDFQQAAMTLCNELAARFDAERVALGWRDKQSMRLHAISHRDGFQPGALAVKGLERAMDEALDQSVEVRFPPVEGDDVLTHDHAEYAHAQHVAHMLTLPLGQDPAWLGAITAERAARPFDEEESRLFALLAELTTARLQELAQRELWLGERAKLALRRMLAPWLGPQRTLSKLLLLLLVALVALLALARAPYRVEADFTLRADNLRILPAPFDGYIDAAYVRLGDVVTAGQLLATLDRKGLQLEQTAALAQVAQREREMEKAKARAAMADLRIAQAQWRQAEAKLEKIRYLLDEARIVAPFDGVVVAGELHKQLGAPVREGETLLKVAALESLHAELAVNERDIHELALEQSGELAFLGRPQDPLPLRIARIDPVARVRDGANVFGARAELTGVAASGAAASWKRPGMTGAARITVGQRSLLWILTHRTVEYLRLALWW
ncbi:putative membrane-fusion protein-like protein [Magnetofaba australis IT-1]|uniref:Putative membrane-fusion protein-like protein n=2 Tax=Magnetofaba TaxID=1472292 RepID=A0A1Y2K541_9PROT|nr:putative membrane-fusion protein-like protein [Magnetofaba australis IT-1]